MIGGILGGGLIAAALAAYMASVTGVADYYRFSKENKSTYATVIELNCKEHMSISYQFIAKGKAINGGADGVDCIRTKAGDKVLVRYLETNPKINTMTDPVSIYLAKLFPVVFFPVVIFLVITFTVLRVLSKNKTPIEKL